MTTCIKYIQHVFQMVITGYLDITEYSKNDIFTSEKKKKRILWMLFIIWFNIAKTGILSQIEYLVLHRPLFILCN